jgi:hypothetical protein
MNRTLEDLQKWKQERLETTRKNALALDDYIPEDNLTTTSSSISMNETPTEEKDPLHLEYEQKKQIWEQEQRALFTTCQFQKNQVHENVRLTVITTTEIVIDDLYVQYVNLITMFVCMNLGSSGYGIVFIYSKRKIKNRSFYFSSTRIKSTTSSKSFRKNFSLSKSFHG